MLNLPARSADTESRNVLSETVLPSPHIVSGGGLSLECMLFLERYQQYQLFLRKVFVWAKVLDFFFYPHVQVDSSQVLLSLLLDYIAFLMLGDSSLSSAKAY